MPTAMKNFAKATLAQPYTASATTITLTSGGGAKFPAVPFNATWWNSTDYGDPADDPFVEIVTVTSISGDILTVTRAAESTTATSKNLNGKTYSLSQTITSALIASFTGTQAGGSSGQVQYNLSTAFAGAANLSIDASGNPVVGQWTTTSPAAPASGTTVISRKLGGRNAIATVSAAGTELASASAFHSRAMFWFRPVPNTASLVTGSYNCSWNSLGVTTARTSATTDFVSSLRRVGIVSNATAGSLAGVYLNNSLSMWRGNAAGLGGFVATWKLGFPTMVSGHRMFVGMISAAQTVDGDPSAQTNIVAIGADAADTNLQVLFNDGVGTCTKVNTGIAKLVSGDFLEVRIGCSPNDSSFKLSFIKNRTTYYDYDTGSSTDIPANTTFLLPESLLGNGAVASSVAQDVVAFLAELDE